MGHTGQAVDQHQDIFALIAKVLGNQVRHVGGFEAQHRRHVGGCRHHHRLGQAFFAQRLADESLHFAAPLAHQADHHHVSLGEAGQHAQEHTFTHAGAGHQTNALTPAQCEQAVDGFDAHIQHAVNRSALHGVDRQAVQAQARCALRFGFAVQRVTPAVNHAAQQLRPQSGKAGVGQCPHQ